MRLIYRSCLLLAVLSVALLVSIGLAPADEHALDIFTERSGPSRAPAGNIGPDLTVSRLGMNSSVFDPIDDFQYWGQATGIRAFSFAVTTCNLGDEMADWLGGATGLHPVIAQNMFRLKDGRFEHIGQSWLKHGFCAVSEATCGDCQPTDCSTLGIGCADTYSSDFNDGAAGGPKSQVNPQGQCCPGPGTHDDPHPFPSGQPAIRGRLQIRTSDINAGGLNFAEAQVITHDEALSERHNNASWREVNLETSSISGVLPGQESVQAQEPAIFAWQLNDEAVIVTVDVPGEGRFHVGYMVTDLGNGTWDYEYALHNLNSDRAAGSFSIPVPRGVAVSQIGFHDVDYHSGEPYSNVDWSAQIIEDGKRRITWFTEPFEQNENANALRWGTLYNFRFRTNSPPVESQATIGLFKPGDPQSIVAVIQGPDMAPSPGACNDDDACTLDSVNPKMGNCVHTPIDCDDRDPCTTDSCDSAVGCINDLLDCDDGDACTVDACDPATIECMYTPLDIDDGDLCTIDTCDPDIGAVYTNIDCGDAQACTDDLCDPASGKCVNPPTDCNDGNLCTLDSCDPGSGCDHVPLACPKGQTCSPLTGQCVAACPTDLNGDGTVNAADLAVLLGAWGSNPSHPADFNADDTVNAADLAFLLGNWGAC